MGQIVHHPHSFRVSLRELFLLVAWAAIGCAALKTAGNVWWTILSTVTLLLVMGLAVVAAGDRGTRQAFAIGFLLWVGIYGFLVTNNQNANSTHSRELDPHDGQLPTSKLMTPLYETMVTRKWIDAFTGKALGDYDPTKPAPNSSGGFGSGFGGGGGFGGTSASVLESPDRREFMRVAHLLWSLLLGYIGGRFAQWVYRRRVSREQSAEPEQIAKT